MKAVYGKDAEFDAITQVSSSTQSARGGFAVARNEDMALCQYCNMLLPVVIFQKHQAQCRHYPAHRHWFGEDYSRLSPSEGMENHQSPHPVHSAELEGESTQAITMLPCKTCQLMFPLEELHGHQVLCFLTCRSLKIDFDSSSGARDSIQHHSYGKLPIQTSRVALLPEKEGFTP